MRIVLNIVLYLGICNIIISKESFFIGSYKENIKETRETRDTCHVLKLVDTFSYLFNIVFYQVILIM